MKLRDMKAMQEENADKGRFAAFDVDIFIF